MATDPVSIHSLQWIPTEPLLTEQSLYRTNNPALSSVVSIKQRQADSKLERHSGSICYCLNYVLCSDSGLVLTCGPMLHVSDCVRSGNRAGAVWVCMDLCSNLYIPYITHRRALYDVIDMIDKSNIHSPVFTQRNRQTTMSAQYHCSALQEYRDNGPLQSMHTHRIQIPSYTCGHTAIDSRALS